MPSAARPATPATALPGPPAPATGFILRPETGAAASAALVPGATVVLVSDRDATARSVIPATTERVATGAREWPDSCGKTELAIHLATALRDAGTVDVVIWVHATSRASVLSAYAQAAAALGLQSAGDADATATSLLGWLSEAAQPWLVVFDDLREAVTLDQLWPAGPAGRVLVTALRPASARPRGLACVVVIPVGPMSRRESLSYLMGRLTEDLDQRQGAADLVAELGDEPLALRQASSVIATSDLTCHGYLDRLIDRRERVPAAAASPAELTWALAVEHSDLLAGTIAHTQLTLASLLDGNGMPYSAFMTAGRQGALTDTALTDSALGQGLTALEAAGLLTIDRALDPPLVRMNWVVQAAARTASPAAAIGHVANAAANALLTDWPRDDRPEWLTRAFRSCTDSLRRVAGDTLWQGTCHKLLLRAGQSLDALAGASAAVDYWSELASTSERLLGGDHPDTLAISDHLARAYLAAGRPADAIAWFQWVRDDRESRLSKDAPETADASRDLGIALLAAGRAEEAVDTLTDAVATYHRVAGIDSPLTLSARDELITALHATGKLSEAIWLGTRVLADRERVQGANHPDTLATGLRLARAYLATGDAKAAVNLLRTVVAGQEKVLGARHTDTIATRCALADAYHGAGKMASAVQLYEQARADYGQVLGAGSRPALSASLNLAYALYAVGRVTDAAKLLRETVDRCEVQLPDGDPLTAAAAESLRNVSGDGAPGEVPAAIDPGVPSAADGQVAGPDSRAGIGRWGAGRHRTGR
ncbi:MAG TPA: tetratricopeptide repeat protein [Trebonia sp.]|jgi:tetratricopeptide (TPR) repeat protein|nr:tetratricopeptide repeat protein [Trebonia sp.]